MAFRTQLLKSWQQPNLLTLLLLPLSCVYRFLFWLRGFAYKLNLKKSIGAPVPVIVVGNITVGGTGKTPMVIYLVELLRKQGYTPGVISRGYSGAAETYPLTVTATTSAFLAGDEPALIVKRTGAPMVIGPNRAESIQQLVRESDVDIIVSDDGLQHLAMQRDIEICIDDQTQTGRNPYLLPAGPYREARSRLKSVDLIVQHIAEESTKGENTMTLQPGKPTPLLRSSSARWQANTQIHAVAGIGNPARFFNTCRTLGLSVIEHALADHHQFSAADIQFGDELPVLMTEKDAVKCVDFACEKHWYLPVNAKLDKKFDLQLISLLKK